MPATTNVTSSSIQPSKYIYKIASAAPQPLSPSSNSSEPILPVSPLDNSSGFIHMSTATQIPGTLDLFFPTSAGERNVVWVIKLQIDRFGEGQVKWESPDGTVTQAREGEGLFPHLYLDDGSEGLRLWLSRNEVLDVRELVSGVGTVGWKDGIGKSVGEDWLV